LGTIELSYYREDWQRQREEDGILLLKTVSTDWTTIANDITYPVCQDISDDSFEPTTKEECQIAVDSISRSMYGRGSQKRLRANNEYEPNCGGHEMEHCTDSGYSTIFPLAEHIGHQSDHGDHLILTCSRVEALADSLSPGRMTVSTGFSEPGRIYHKDYQNDGRSKTPKGTLEELITSWGDLPSGCSVMWQAENPWHGHQNIWNKDLPAFWRPLNVPQGTWDRGLGCDYCLNKSPKASGFSHLFASVCFKPEPLKATLNDQFASTKSFEWHLAAPGQTKCPKSRSPKFYECAEAAKNIMTKYYPDDSHKSMQWVDTKEATVIDLVCNRAGWGSTPIGCSMRTRQNRDKGSLVPYYLEPGIRDVREGVTGCYNQDIDPDLQLICEGIEPVKTPDMKDMDETEEMYKNYCDVVNSDIGRGFSPLNPGKGWCGTVPLLRSNLAENDLKDWVHQSECLKHRKCIAGFGDRWSTDSHVDCVDTVSPCHWNARNPRALRCLTGLSYAQRSAQWNDPITRTFEKVADTRALTDTYTKSKIAWTERRILYNLKVAEAQPSKEAKKGYLDKVMQGVMENNPGDTQPERSWSIRGDGRSGSLSARGMMKEYTTHFEHCGGSLFRRRLLGEQDEERDEAHEHEEGEEGEEDEEDEEGEEDEEDEEDKAEGQASLQELQRRGLLGSGKKKKTQLQNK